MISIKTRSRMVKGHALIGEKEGVLKKLDLFTKREQSGFARYLRLLSAFILDDYYSYKILKL